MIKELFFMNGYAVYVLSAFSFTLLSFLGLYLTTKKSVKKLNKVNKNADQTYRPYPLIKNKFSIITYLTLYF